MSTQIHCFKCKQKTDTNNITEEISKNNRKMLKGICKVCGSKKSVFIKMHEKSTQINKSEKVAKQRKGTANKVLQEIYKILTEIENESQEKYGRGLYLGPLRNYEGAGIFAPTMEKHGGFIPLAALIPAIGAILGGVGGAAGGIASAVNSSKSVAEQERHNREIEKMTREQIGSGVEKYDCKFKKHGSGLFLGPLQV